MKKEEIERMMGKKINRFGSTFQLISAIYGIDVFGDSKTYGQLVDRAFEEYDKKVIERHLSTLEKPKEHNNDFKKDWRIKAIQKANSNEALRKKTQEGLKKFRNPS